MGLEYRDGGSVDDDKVGQESPELSGDRFVMQFNGREAYRDYLGTGGTMCAAAIAGARIERLCYGAEDPKSGGVAHGARVFSHPQAHHVPEVIDGIGAKAASDLLRAFFADRR